MLAVVGILVLGAAVRTPPTARSRELSRDRETFLVAAADSPTAPKIARGPIDVIQTTAGSFLSVGGFGFAFTALQESIKRSNVGGRARARVPYFVFRASIANGQRWGRVSAGFAGGRAWARLCVERTTAPVPCWAQSSVVLPLPPIPPASLPPWQRLRPLATLSIRSLQTTAPRTVPSSWKRLVRSEHGCKSSWRHVTGRLDGCGQPEGPSTAICTALVAVWRIIQQ